MIVSNKNKKTLRYLITLCLILSISTIIFSTVAAQNQTGSTQTLTNPTSTASPDFYLYSSPLYLTTPLGTSQNSTIALASVNGFNGAVSLKLTLPTGLTTANLISEQLVIKTGESNNTKLTVTVPNTANVGRYTIQVNAESNGISHQTYVIVTVVKPDFSINFIPSYLTTLAETTQKSSLQISPAYGWVGTITLSAKVPQSLQASQIPQTVTLNSKESNTSALSVYVPLGTSAGTYVITVTATSGSITHQANLTICVLSPDFSISACPSYVTILTGSASNTTIRVNPLSRLNGTIYLTSNIPAGLTLTSPLAQSLSVNMSSSNTTSLSLLASPNIQPGNYIVTVTGTYGSITHKCNVTICVIKPDFALSATPSKISASAGSYVGATITIRSLERYNGTITITASAPTGWATPILMPSTLTLNCSTNSTAVIISIPTTAIDATNTITITGTSGSLTHTTNLILTASS